MANLSFVIHCIDGAVVASDLWDWPGEAGASEVKRLGETGCIIVHGIDPAFAQQAWEFSNLETFAPGKSVAEIQQEAGRKIAEFSKQSGAEGKPVPQFGFLIAGYFREYPDLVKVYIDSNNPAQPQGFAHNVFTGYNDIARALDRKILPRSLTTELGLRFAAFCILQSHTVLFGMVGSHFALAKVTREKGFLWIPRDELIRIQEDAAIAGWRFSRLSLSMFRSEEERSR